LKEYEFKTPISGKNTIMSFKEKFINYIIKLKFMINEFVVNSKRKTGFIGFIVCLESVVHIYNSFIQNTVPRLQYITY
jgi:hypothetical protein